MRRALVIAALMATGCGGRSVPAPPRSSCADAAASIVRGLRASGHEDAATIEGRLAATCRKDHWRGAVVRCFALARDPAELRVCSRRLEPVQRTEARALQHELDGEPTKVGGGRASGTTPACERLAEVFVQFSTCPPLVARFGPSLPELSAYTERSLARAAEAVQRRDAAAAVRADADCDMLGARLRDAVDQAGC